MKKTNLVKILTLMITSAVLLTSCFGRQITRNQAAQILEDIGLFQTSDNYSLGPTIAISYEREEMDSDDNIVQNYFNIHLASGEYTGKQYVYFEAREYISNKLTSSIEKWAYLRDGYFFINNTIGELVYDEEDLESEPEFKTYSECIIETDIGIAFSSFSATYHQYYLYTTQIIKLYSNATEQANDLKEIENYILKGYEYDESYTTIGNRCVRIEYTQTRPSTSGDKLFSEHVLEYYDAKLVEYYFEDFIEDKVTAIKVDYSSTLTLPTICMSTSSEEESEEDLNSESESYEESEITSESESIIGQ